MLKKMILIGITILLFLSLNTNAITLNIPEPSQIGGVITISPTVTSTHDGVTTTSTTQRGGGAGPSGGRNDPVANPSMKIEPIDQIKTIAPVVEAPTTQKSTIKTLNDFLIPGLNSGLKTIPGTLLQGKQPTSELTPAELAIRQGNQIASYAQTLQGKNLTGRTIEQLKRDMVSEGFLVNELRNLEEKRLYDMQKQALDQIKTEITTEQNQFNSELENYKKNILVETYHQTNIHKQKKNEQDY